MDDRERERLDRISLYESELSSGDPERVESAVRWLAFIDGREDDWMFCDLEEER